jgi:uncharacterized lipoprotein YmbA
MMRRPVARALRPGLLAAAALLAGCFGRGVAPQYFTLSPAAVSASPAGAGAPLAARPDLGLAVGPIEFPRYLDRPEIVTRDGAHRLVLWDEHRWGGSLRSDILRVMADDLGTLLGTTRVVTFPVEPRYPLAYRVLPEILEFEGVLGGSVTLRARWTVVGLDGRAVAIEESRFEQATASASWQDLVAAQSAALGRLTRQIAERIASLPAPQPAAPAGHRSG